MTKKEHIEEGEQLQLIEIHDKAAKKLVEPARDYRRTITKRLSIQKKEAEQKATLIEGVKALVNEGKIQPLEENDKEVVRFKIEGITVEYTHEDKDNVRVKEDEE